MGGVSGVREFQVIGGGSIGLLLAGRLAAAGFAVTVRTRTREQAARLTAEGVTVQPPLGGPDIVAAVRAAALDEDVAARPPGLTLLAVKQTALADNLAERLARAVPAGATLAAFCNGLGHTDWLAGRLPGRGLLAAVATEGALKTGPTAVRHTGSGDIWLGRAPLFESGAARLAAGDEASARQAAAWLREGGFSANVSNDMTERMLRKLLGNAVINPLTALLRVANGELPGTPARLEMLRRLFDETLAVLRAAGLKTDDDLWGELLALCARTAANRSSMLQDVLAGRQTEIASINGAVARLAAASGLSAPLNEAVAALIGAMHGDDTEG